jgi:tetrahydromethanopterin S-methyltransferase subunit B
MDDIVLDRGSSSIMRLDDAEQRLFDEIAIEQPRVQRAPRPTPRHKIPPLAAQPQEGLEAFANPAKQANANAPPPSHDDYDDESEFDDEEEYVTQQEEQPSAGFKTVDEEKADLLNKLKRLETKGFSVNKRLNAYSNIDDLRTEYNRISHSINAEQAVKFSRRMLIACVTGLEFLNRKYSPFDLQLDGWGESVHENIDDYNGVLEELYDKYSSKMEVAPEVKLVLMLGSSAFLFHLTNSMFKAMPNMNDVIKQNPDLVKNMMSAVQNTKTPAQQQEGGGGAYEMSGPGLDIGALMNGMGSMGMPPIPMNTSRDEVRIEDVDDDVSDIVSEIDEELLSEDDETQVKEVSVPTKTPAKKRGRKPKKDKVEINL